MAEPEPEIAEQEAQIQEVEVSAAAISVIPPIETVPATGDESEVDEADTVSDAVSLVADNGPEKVRRTEVSRGKHVRPRKKGRRPKHIDAPGSGADVVEEASDLDVEDFDGGRVAMDPDDLSLEADREAALATSYWDNLHRVVAPPPHEIGTGTDLDPDGYWARYAKAHHPED